MIESEFIARWKPSFKEDLSEPLIDCGDSNEEFDIFILKLNKHANKEKWVGGSNKLYK